MILCILPVDEVRFILDDVLKKRKEISSIDIGPLVFEAYGSPNVIAWTRIPSDPTKFSGLKLTVAQSMLSDRLNLSPPFPIFLSRA